MSKYTAKDLASDLASKVYGIFIPQRNSFGYNNAMKLIEELLRQRESVHQSQLSKCKRERDEARDSVFQYGHEVTKLTLEIEQQQETIERLREALQKIYDLEGDIRPEYAAPLFASIHRTAKQALLQEQGSKKGEQ